MTPNPANPHTPAKRSPRPLCLLLAAILTLAQHSLAQDRAPLPTSSPNTHRRTHLILKDGSYQLVMSYTVQGNIVRYVSAERGGDVEEIPLSLVDLDATTKYEQAHDPDQQGKPPALDPKLAKEEAERASRTPEVAPDLRLSTEDSVLLLDTYQGTPELVPLAQNATDLNKQTAHAILPGLVNPLAASHQIVQLPGIRAYVQAHVAQPDLYLRLGDDSLAPTGSAPMVVDTHGAQGKAVTAPSGGSPDSTYVIVRADVRRDVRVLTSFKISALGDKVHRQEDIVETKTEVLPGGHWMKVTPKNPLDFGEYALMEVLSDREVNLGVWDFGIHPTAPENRDALHPPPPPPVTLERHRPDE
jgi:hypothetical protein